MAPIPKTMSGIAIENTGGPEVLQWKTDLPVPDLKEGEVLVKNEYVGVNFIDTFVSPHQTPFSLPLAPSNTSAVTSAQASTKPPSP